MRRFLLTLAASLCMVISCGFSSKEPAALPRINMNCGKIPKIFKQNMVDYYIRHVVDYQGAIGLQLSECSNKEDMEEEKLTPMEALDLVKDSYASDFERVDRKDSSEYYYMLQIADYYLVYEDTIHEEQEYLIHLYEFVVDDPEIGIGHMVTYGWYTVDRKTGEIKDQTQ